MAFTREAQADREFDSETDGWPEFAPGEAMMRQGHEFELQRGTSRYSIRDGAERRPSD